VEVEIAALASTLGARRRGVEYATGGMSVEPRALEADAPATPDAWYTSAWAMAAAGYVFPPLGMYLMWRYRDWRPWVKAAFTLFGAVLAVVSSYLSGKYVWPRVF